MDDGWSELQRVLARGDGETVAQDRSEQARDERRRIAEFRLLGFSGTQSVVLADSSVDLRDAHALVSRGCPPEVVFELLAGP